MKKQLIWVYDKKADILRNVTIQTLIKALNEYNNRKLEPIKYFTSKKEGSEYKKAYTKFLNNLNK